MAGAVPEGGYAKVLPDGDLSAELSEATNSTQRSANRPGPIGEVQRAFEDVRKLPRKQQRKVVEFVFAFVNEFKRKAS